MRGERKATLLRIKAKLVMNSFLCLLTLNLAALSFGESFVFGLKSFANSVLVKFKLFLFSK